MRVPPSGRKPDPPCPSPWRGKAVAQVHWAASLELLEIETLVGSEVSVVNAGNGEERKRKLLACCARPSEGKTPPSKFKVRVNRPQRMRNLSVTRFHIRLLH